MDIHTADRTAGGPQRRAGGRPAVNRIPAETVVHGDSRWDVPRKRALFTSDKPESTTSGSDIPEGHTDRPPEVECTEGLCSPNWELEMAMIQLQKDFDDCRTEFEAYSGGRPLASEAVGIHVDASSTILREIELEQYREVFEAIVCSNGWDDVTAALQLPSHLDGDALNVALLVPESRRVVP